MKGKIEIEREVEMQGFSGGEILKRRYTLVWQKVRCYECGGLGHRKRDHKETKRKKDKIQRDKIREDKKEIAKEKIEKDEKKKKKKKSEKKKIEKREIGVETERDKIVEEKREMLR